MSSSIHHAPQVLLDFVVPAGAITPTEFSEPFLLPDLNSGTLVYYHAGFGAGAAGGFDVSADGVTWVTGNNMTLTATVPTASTQTPSDSGNHRFIRVRVTNGGANGGRLVVLLIRREER